MGGSSLLSLVVRQSSAGDIRRCSMAQRLRVVVGFIFLGMLIQRKPRVSAGRRMACCLQLTQRDRGWPCASRDRSAAGPHAPDPPASTSAAIPCLQRRRLRRSNRSSSSWNARWLASSKGFSRPSASLMRMARIEMRARHKALRHRLGRRMRAPVLQQLRQHMGMWTVRDSFRRGAGSADRPPPGRCG